MYMRLVATANLYWQIKFSKIWNKNKNDVQEKNKEIYTISCSSHSFMMEKTGKNIMMGHFFITVVIEFVKYY